MSVWQQKQLERQARFWELIRQSRTNTAASEAVGVERHQGYWWRLAAGYQPLPGLCRGAWCRWRSG